MGTLTLKREEYRDRIYGGWLGKNIGGTLGAPIDGSADIQNLKFYEPEPGQAAAFDGLDFQLAWLHALREHGPEITPDQLVAVWQQYLTYPWDEYGYALQNLRRNLRPALSGTFDNWFKHGIRGAARSDLWGMLAPGCPQVAAESAYQDSSIDHADEGIWAAMFVASIESAAFFIQDIYRLLEVGSAMIPPESRVGRAVRTARDAFGQDATPLDARGRILTAVGSENYTDSPQNIGFVALGLLYGKGDFGASLATTVNCGYASQFTGAAVGTVLGIINGRAKIPQNWLDPVGEAVVLGWGLVGLDVERTVSELADHTADAAERYIAANCPGVQIGEFAVTALPESPAVSSAVPPTAPGESPAPAAAVATESAQPEAAPKHFLELDDHPDPGVQSAAETPAAEPASATPTAASDSEDSVPTIPDLSARDSEESVPTVPQSPVSTTPDTAGELPVPSQPDVPVSSSSEAPPVPESAVQSGSPTETQILTPSIPIPPPFNWTENTLVQPLLKAPTTIAVYHSGDFEFTLDYGAAGPVALPGVATSFTVAVRNLGGQDFVGSVTIQAPEGWQVAVPGAQGQRQMLAQGRMARYGFVLRAPENAPLKTRNSVTLVMTPESAAATTLEIPLFGGSCWWFIGPFRNLSDEGYDHAYGPEDNLALDKDFLARDGGLIKWQRMAFGSTVMELEKLFTGVPGVGYGQTTLHVSEPTDARIVVHSNDGSKVWLNGQRILQRHSHEPFRPTLGYGPAQADIALKAGDNKVLLKVVRCGSPIELSFIVTDREGKPLPELGNTRW